MPELRFLRGGIVGLRQTPASVQNCNRALQSVHFLTMNTQGVPPLPQGGSGGWGAGLSALPALGPTVLPDYLSLAEILEFC